MKESIFVSRPFRRFAEHPAIAEVLADRADQRVGLFVVDEIGWFGDPRGHRRRDLQCLVNPDEIIMDGLDGDRVDMVLDPLAERVGEPREAAYRHANRQIVALDH